MLRYLTGQIRSHKTIKVARSNCDRRESSQGPVLRGNIQPLDGRKARMGVRLLGRVMLRLDGCGGHQLQFCGNGLNHFAK